MYVCAQTGAQSVGLMYLWCVCVCVLSMCTNWGVQMVGLVVDVLWGVCQVWPGVGVVCDVCIHCVHVVGM